MGTRSHFVPTEPVRVSLPDDPDEWIAIRQKLSMGEKTALEASMIRMRQTDGKSDLQVTADVECFLRLQMEMFVVDWHLTGPDGEPVPFARERIGDLDDDDPLVELAVREIASRTPFGKKRSSG